MEVLVKLKNALISLGIQPATFRLVARCRVSPLRNPVARFEHESCTGHEPRTVRDVLLAVSVLTGNVCVPGLKLLPQLNELR
jgi:hypothetical protein